MTFDLNQHVARLLLEEPFFAALSRHLDKRPDTGIKTAGVRLNPETARYEMIYNPAWFERCIALREGKEEQFLYVKGTLLHEFYHVVFGHLAGRLPEGGLSKQWNVAGDLAINTHLMRENGDHMLPEGVCFPGVGPFAEYPAGLSAEAYYRLLTDDENQQQQGEDGDQASEGAGGAPSDENDDGQGSGGDSQFDDHSGWADGADEMTRRAADQRMQDAIKKAAHEAENRGWGSVSGSTRQDIRASLQTKVDWRKVLRNFVKTSVRANKRSTVKRINKRFPYIHAGRKVRREARLAISIDQSGSVSDSMLEAFFSELNKLAGIVEFTVVPFDTRVDEKKVFVWNKGQRVRAERVLCGGTDFNAPTQYVNDKGFDGHIVLTDMEAPKPGPSRCRRMWMTTAGYARRPYFQTNERVIAIDE
jgi:predicted metal-dependent peptidase